MNGQANRKGKVVSKTKTPVEMIPAPSLTPEVVTLDIQIDSGNIGAFRAFMRLRKKVAGVNLKSLESVGEMVDGIVEYLVEYGNCTEAQLNALSFEQLTGALTEIGAVFTGKDIPQKKSAT